MRYLVYPLLVCLLQFNCNSTLVQDTKLKKEEKKETRFSKDIANKIHGLSFVAPPQPFEMNPMPAVEAIGAEWIAIIPFAYTRQGTPDVRYDEGGYQWWGERPEGALETIKLAKASGRKIMMKPQVYVMGSWPGGMDFETDKEWEKWEAKYEAYIMPFATMSKQAEIELFCIGTEFKISVKKRPAFWKQLIEKIRTEYKGKLVYAANWDNYQNIPFWNDLDYIGVDAYFPLVDKTTPTVEDIVKGWDPHLKGLRQVAKKEDRPILFTEFGYLSVDGCAYKNWELESKVKSLNVNEAAQANAIDGMFQVFAQEDYWAGGFIWKWFPNMKGHEGYIERDYTPQGKKGGEVLKSWYSN